MLTDSPFSDAQALLVTFSQVRAHRSGGTFETLPFVSGGTSRTCDLKKLVTATGALPPGHFTRLRLVVARAVVYFDNPSIGTPCASTLAVPSGSSASVEIPSNEIRLNHEFDVTSNETTTTLLEFDGDPFGQANRERDAPDGARHRGCECGVASVPEITADHGRGIKLVPGLCGPDASSLRRIRGRGPGTVRLARSRAGTQGSRDHAAVHARKSAGEGGAIGAGAR